MVAFAIRRTLQATGGALALAALMTPSTVFSQRASGAEQQRQIQAVERDRRVIEQLQTRHGSQPEGEDFASDERQQMIEDLQREIQAAASQDDHKSAGLIDPLAALGSLYQDDGDHLRAAAATERALHLIRFNYGLHSLDQAPLIRQSIQSADAIGDVETAWDLEQELLSLAERHAGDLRAAGILHELADDRVDLLARYDAGEFPRELVLGCYYDTDCTSGSRRHVKRRLLSEARSYYALAIDAILRSESYSSNELPQLLMKLVRISYAYNLHRIGRSLTPRDGADDGLGRLGLRYLLAYQAMNSEPWFTRIDTLVQIADWELLHSRSGNSNDQALATYEQAYRLLQEHEIAQASIEQIFLPTIPTVLPAFLPNPLVSEKPQEATGYIDVVFEITKHGKAERVEILETTGNATRPDERRLVELVLRSRFRPRLANGQFVDTGPIFVRYYLNESDGRRRAGR